jgi:hypothetical protein
MNTSDTTTPTDLYRAKTSLGVVSWPFTEVRLPCRIR